MFIQKPHKNVYSNFSHNGPWTAKQWRGLSVGEWINNQWYLQTMEYYPTLKKKKKKLSSHEKTWRNLKCILLGEKPIWKGYILYDFNYMASGKDGTMETVKKNPTVAKGWREREMIR